MIVNDVDRAGLTDETYPAEFTVRADLRPIEGQDPGHEGQQDALVTVSLQQRAAGEKERTYDPPQETGGPLVGQVGEHKIGDQGKDAGQDVATERLGGNGRAGVAVVGIGQVVEGGQVDGEDAHGGTAQGQHGHDPRHGRERRPAEPEQADGHEGGLDAGEEQARLGGAGQFAQACGGLFLVDAEQGGQHGPDGDGWAGLVDSIEPPVHQTKDGTHLKTLLRLAAC